MNMARVMRRALASVGCVALMALSAAPAHAVKPQHELLIDQGIISGIDFDCGSFILLTEPESERLHVVRYFDQDGDEVRVLVTVAYRGVLVRSDTGEIFPDQSTGTDTLYPDGSFVGTGVKFRVVVPGEGEVFVEAGRFVLDASGNVLFQAGQTDFASGGVAALCAAVS